MDTKKPLELYVAYSLCVSMVIKLFINVDEVSGKSRNQDGVPTLKTFK